MCYQAPCRCVRSSAYLKGSLSQGFYAMPLSLPPAPGYAPQSQDLSQDMLSDAAFGAPQQQMGGHMPGVPHTASSVHRQLLASALHQSGPHCLSSCRNFKMMQRRASFECRWNLFACRPGSA